VARQWPVATAAGGRSGPPATRLLASYAQCSLREALLKAGFASITEHLIQQSGDPELCNLENDGRMPPGFLQLETMTLEGEAA
jgi:hypothetical protein